MTRKIAQTDIVGGSPAPCALAALAARQDNIIARLEELRDQVGMWFCSAGVLLRGRRSMLSVCT